MKIVIEVNIIIDRNLKIAYGAQKAWLLNATLKDNILFGCEEKTKR